MRTVAGYNAHKGDLSESRPARWSLWTWLKKHAKGRRALGLWRKKSTAAMVSWAGGEELGGDAEVVLLPTVAATVTATYL